MTGWMVGTECRIICVGVQPTFIRVLAAVFATFYIFNLQYQDEVAQTLEFIQRCFIAINLERGIKASHGKVVSKKTGKLVEKKAAAVNIHVIPLWKNLMDFQCHFVK